MGTIMIFTILIHVHTYIFSLLNNWKASWHKWKLLHQVKQTSSCCRRLKTSPVSMSFSRASFSLSVFSLCTSSWTVLNSLSNLHTSTEWWKFQPPSDQIRLMRNHIGFKSQHNNMHADGRSLHWLSLLLLQVVVAALLSLQMELCVLQLSCQPLGLLL